MERFLKQVVLPTGIMSAIVVIPTFIFFELCACFPKVHELYDTKIAAEAQCDSSKMELGNENYEDAKIHSLRALIKIYDWKEGEKDVIDYLPSKFINLINGDLIGKTYEEAQGLLKEAKNKSIKRKILKELKRKNLIRKLLGEDIFYKA